MASRNVLSEFYNLLIQTVNKLKETSEALGDAYYFNLVYKTVYNRRGKEYRYLYLNRYDNGFSSRVVAKVDDPELDEKLFHYLHFKSTVRLLDEVARDLEEFKKKFERLMDDLELLAALYDYLQRGIKEGKVNGEKEEVKIALRLLEPIYRLVRSDGSG